MARPLRLEDIFFENEDRSEFLSILGEVCGHFNWVVHAYCQMTNPYHLLMGTLEANLSRGMRQLNGVYTYWFNRTHHHVGHAGQTHDHKNQRVTV
jgi:REP element-mobilizing transposase RayT